MRFIAHLLLFLYSLINKSCAQKLLLLFLDGFRWDYIKDTKLIGFQHLISEGAYINQVTPVFPADCHPNIYSMFTGLYPQHHGVVANKVYSKTWDRIFDHSDPIHRRNLHKWVNAEPLWVTAKSQGKVSFVYHLPICESSVGPLSPSYCVPYHLPDMTMERLNVTIGSAIRSLRSGVADLAVVYNDEMDRLTHSYGPESYQLYQDMLPTIDAMIQVIIKAIWNTDISFVIVSDHGMAQIAKDRTIDLERIILRSEIAQVVNQGGFAGLWPVEGLQEQVHLRLLLASQDPDSHFSLYTHASLPAHWNAIDHHLTPPLLLMADLGYFLESNELFFPADAESYDSGWHGYSPDSESMASPLLALGPTVRRGARLSSGHVTDTYQLLAALAGLRPNPHNGSLGILPSLLLVEPPPSPQVLVVHAALAPAGPLASPWALGLSMIISRLPILR